MTEKRVVTRKDVMADPCTHRFTKEVLLLSHGLDIVDRYYDAQLAADVLRGEMDQALEEGA